MTSTFDLDSYLTECGELYRYLSQGEIWIPQKPRRPLPIADMDLTWRFNAANFLLHRARGYVHRYHFGFVHENNAPRYREVVGEDCGQPVFSGAAFSEAELMSDHAADAVDAEAERNMKDPEAWMKSTALYRALVADLPEGDELAGIAGAAKHRSACPVRAGYGACECAAIKAAAEAGAQ